MTRFFASAFIVAAVVLLGAGGCIFDTREPAPPDTQEACPWVVPIDPDTLIKDNMVTAMGCRDSTTGAPTGSINYARLFAEGLVFDADDQDSLDLIIDSHPEAFLNWTRDVETSVFNQLAPSVDSIRVVFGDDPSSRGAGTAELRTNYMVTLYDSTSIKNFAGFVTFHMVEQGDGSWRITRWVDERADSTTWGKLKGSIRVGIPL